MNIRWRVAVLLLSLLLSGNPMKGKAAAADNRAKSAPGALESIDVFSAGRDDIEGVENAREQYTQFREQNVVVTNSGAVVMVCQARNKSAWSDRSGQDLVCRISRDSGKTWSKAKRIATYDLKSICPNAAVYDREKNRIHVLYNLFTWD